jgi:hypothetical protein
MDGGKSDTAGSLGDPGKPWPGWARWVVSVALLVHVSAVLAGALGAPPSSDLEHDAAEFFAPYHQVLDQGDSYRYYSTAFPPTPVVNATLTFADGRPDKIVRIPERGLRPRLLYQRQLALAHGLMEDFEAARAEGDGSKSRWAHAFARHLCRSNPGCSSVTLHLQMHLVPTMERVKELLKTPTLTPVDLDAEEFTTAPERIGVFPCDAS